MNEESLIEDDDVLLIDDELPSTLTDEEERESYLGKDDSHSFLTVSSVYLNLTKKWLSEAKLKPRIKTSRQKISNLYFDQFSYFFLFNLNQQQIVFTPKIFVNL